MAERKEPKEFDLEATIAAILQYLGNAGQKEIPTLRELSEMLGPSQPTFSVRYNEILTALEARVKRWDVNADGSLELKEKLTQAVAAKRKEMAERKEPKEFDLEATIAAILQYLGNAGQKEIPTLRELSEMLGPSQPTFSVRYNEILTALEARVKRWDVNADGSLELKEKLTQAVAAKRKEMAERKEPKEQQELLSWANGQRGKIITRKYLEKIKKELTQYQLSMLGRLLSTNKITVSDMAMSSKQGEVQDLTMRSNKKFDLEATIAASVRDNTMMGNRGGIDLLHNHEFKYKTTMAKSNFIWILLCLSTTAKRPWLCAGDYQYSVGDEHSKFGLALWCRNFLFF